MKLLITSDLHLNMNVQEPLDSNISFFARQQADYINTKGYTHYIINGDISWFESDIELFLKTLKDNLINCKVLRNLGNHCLSKHLTVSEYINFNTDDYLGSNPIITDKAIVLGTSGFFDLSYTSDNSDEYIDILMEDVNKRYFKKESPLKLTDVEQILPKLLLRVKEQLDSIPNKEGKKLIFINHYMPNKEFLVKATDARTLFKNAFMGSDLISKFLEDNCFTECFFGHTHRRLPCKVINNVTYHCKPFGTIREWTKWDYPTKNLYEQWVLSMQEIDV